MKWYFQDRSADAGAEQDDSYTQPGLISLPAELLERHGARVLDPGQAATLSTDATTLRPTIYRRSTLLIPGHLLRKQDFLDAVDAALAGVKMQLASPAGPDQNLAEGEGDIFEELRQLPRPAVLVPAADSGPVVVDAWVALQALRAAAASQQYLPLDLPTVMQIYLERLAVGSGITGSPIGNGGGGIAGGPGAGSVSGPSTTDSYLFSGGDPRTPVALILDTPAYKSDTQVESEYGQRPVVAVLDTGLGPHPWLGVYWDEADGFTVDPNGPVAIDDRIQYAIYAQGQQAEADGDRPRQLIDGAWDKPMTANPLVGELNPAFGHGTFIAGIVRQVAPDARILAVRVMHSDDVAYEGDILCALRQLAYRIALGAEGDVAATVHVISMSFGYFSESPGYEAETSALWPVIKILLRLGVIVVAAAGNYATSRRFYPAAFATEKVADDEVPVVSVGALNPNGTKAMFSDEGSWVMAQAPGAAVVSTFPIIANASRSPDLKMPVGPTPPGLSLHERAALDPDDFTCGWAVWSGTSFSAPYIAARFIRSLQEGAEGGLKLNRSGKKVQAKAAWDNLRQQGNRGE